MISKEGLIFYYSYQFLYYSMQMYYEFHESEEIHFDVVADRHRRWTSEYHEIMGWCLEENSFPIHHETITKKEAIAIDNFGEVRGYIIFKSTYKAILDTSRNMHASLGEINIEVFIYHLYCKWLLYILGEFSVLLQQYLGKTVYIDIYSDHAQTFEQLSRSLRGEEPSDDNIPHPIKDHIRRLAAELSKKWREAVLSTASDFRWDSNES